MEAVLRWSDDVQMWMTYNDAEDEEIGRFWTPQQGVLVVHRGRIGGGRDGIGKSLFWDNYRGRILTAIDGDRETDFAVVGDLESPCFAYQVRNFVAEVERIKDLP